MYDRASFRYTPYVTVLLELILGTRYNFSSSGETAILVLSFIHCYHLLHVCKRDIEPQGVPVAFNRRPFGILCPCWTEDGV